MGHNAAPTRETQPGVAYGTSRMLFLFWIVPIFAVCVRLLDYSVVKVLQKSSYNIEKGDSMAEKPKLSLGQRLRVLFDGGPGKPKTCAHLDQIQDITPSVQGCEECLDR